jgi:hypothetical protein
MRGAEIVKSKPRALSRRLPAGFTTEIRHYATHTGLAVWTWNSLHGNLSLIFWFLTGREREMALYLALHQQRFHSTGDDSQRS